MVGSSASASAVGPVLSAGFAGGGGGGSRPQPVSRHGWRRRRCRSGHDRRGRGGRRGNGGRVASQAPWPREPAAGSPAAWPEPLGMKEKSSASDDEIHGTCSWREARVTPTRVRFSVSSAIRSGVRISLSSSLTNRLRSPPLSETTGRERGRVHHEGAVRRDHRRKACGKAAETALERVAPGGVDQRDLDAGAAAVDLSQHGLETETVAANIRFGPDLGIDRDHVALPARLHAEAGEEYQRHRARLDLAVQALEGAAHLLAGQVLADIDIEAVALELFGDVAGVVDRLLQRRLGVRIFRVADHQRIALTGGERRGYRRD